MNNVDAAGKGEEQAEGSPRSLREVLEQRVPLLIAAIQQRGGPTEEDWEAARAFSEILASRGDIVLFPPDTFKEQTAAEEIQQALCQHVAVAAFCPGGITLFGLHIVAYGVSLRHVPGGCPGMFPVRVKHERKTTGSFYTPMSLVDCLLDSALNPVMNEAATQANPEEALLALRIGDPACGSGAFPRAAAERLARRVAQVRQGGDQEPTREEWRRARRDVVARCIFAVDLNPAAVELCKLTLSFQAIDPTKPFPFLDAHVQCGNGILGTTPALLKQGIPDGAFEPIEGDDPAVARAYKKQNKAERLAQQGLFATTTEEQEEPAWKIADRFVTHLLDLIDALPDDTLAQRDEKHWCYTDFLQSETYEYSKLRADAWCAAFVWKKTRELPGAITEGVFREIERNPGEVAPWMREEIDRLARQYQFFHWHLAFPQVLRAPGMRRPTKAAVCTPEEAEPVMKGGKERV